tara:strand:+ start:136 stop:888 length:753 start_codon:yes stop_codon:yes gene_type:complete
MYLIGDIGNTEVKIIILNKNFKKLKKLKFKTNLISENYLKKKLNFLITRKNISKALFCSVVPKVMKILKKFIRKNLQVNCSELKNFNLSQFIKILVNKKQIGSDRIANAIAVNNNRTNFIIVDFGTATTFDVIKNNSYIGGVIAPGISLSLKNLTKSASLIPNINIKKESKIVGKNTIASVRSGFYWGYTGLISNIIKLIKKQTNSNYKIIFTGGLANFFKNSFSFKLNVDKDLTLKGVLKVLKGNFYEK